MKKVMKKAIILIPLFLSILVQSQIDTSISRPWIRWGAPVKGYKEYTTFEYTNKKGYKLPARSYVYYDGSIDTIYSKRTYGRAGLGYNTDNLFGVWGTFFIDNNYFIFDYFQVIGQKNRSVFLNDMTLSDAVNNGDKRLSDLNSSWSIYGGVGRNIKNFGIHLMIGYGIRDIRYQFKGIFQTYSFTKVKEYYPSGKFGILYDNRNLILKSDYEPFRKIGSFGIGIFF